MWIVWYSDSSHEMSSLIFLTLNCLSKIVADTIPILFIIFPRKYVISCELSAMNCLKNKKKIKLSSAAVVISNNFKKVK